MFFANFVNNIVILILFNIFNNVNVGGKTLFNSVFINVEKIDYSNKQTMRNYVSFELHIFI